MCIRDRSKAAHIASKTNLPARVGSMPCFWGYFVLGNGHCHGLAAQPLRSGEIVPQNGMLVKISKNFMALMPDRIFSARRFDKETKTTILGYSILEIIFCQARGDVCVQNRPQ